MIGSGNSYLAGKQEVKARPDGSIRVAVHVAQVSVLKGNTIRALKGK